MGGAATSSIIFNSQKSGMPCIAACRRRRRRRRHHGGNLAGDHVKNTIKFSNHREDGMEEANEVCVRNSEGHSLN